MFNGSTMLHYKQEYYYLIIAERNFDDLPDEVVSHGLAEM